MDPVSCWHLATSPHPHHRQCPPKNCNTFLARKTSLSTTSGLRHALLLLHSTNLGSKVFSVWVNLRLFRCMGTVSLVKGNITASTKAVHWALFLIRDTMIKWFHYCWLLFSKCLWAAPVHLIVNNKCPTEMHASRVATWVHSSHSQ